MKDKDLAAKVLTYLGGAGNISDAYNCYTRLRAEVKNVELVKTNEIKELDGVIGVVVADKQIQVIVGTGKSVKVTQELKRLMRESGSGNGSTNKDAVQTAKEELEEFKKTYKSNKEKVRGKKSRTNVFFKKIAGIFVPIVPAFIACGLVLAVLEITKAALHFNPETDVLPGALVVINALGSSVFAILEVIVGYNACKEFGGDGIIGGCLAGFLASADLAGIKIGSFELQPGAGGVITVLLIAIAAAYFEKLLRKFMPNIIDAFMTPLLTLCVMGVVGIFVAQPFGGLLSEGISKGVNGILEHVPILMGLIPAFYLPMVLFGVHHALIPISQTLIDTFGYSQIVAVQLMGGAAEVGAAIYFILTTRNKKMKRTVIQSLPIGFLGIDEPLIWGLTFPLKKLFIPIGITGFIVGGIMSNFRFGAIVPETTGIEATLLMKGDPNCKLIYALSFIGAIVLGFILTAIIGYKETYEVTNPDGSVTEMEHESSYFAKKIWPNFKNTKFYAKAKKVLIVIATPFKKLLTKMHILKPKAKKEESVVVDKNAILSPLKGNIVPIESLSDKTFSGKVMGDGIAIVPTEGKIYAPIDGTISALLDTKHAYGITSDEGCELLIHIGQNTVNLKGEHFTTLVKEGDCIKKGDLLGTFDIKAITDKGYNIATPIIVIAGGDFAIKQKAKTGAINVGDVLLTVTK